MSIQNLYEILEKMYSGGTYEAPWLSQVSRSDLIFSGDNVVWIEYWRAGHPWNQSAEVLFWNGSEVIRTKPVNTWLDSLGTLQVSGNNIFWPIYSSFGSSYWWNGTSLIQFNDTNMIAKLSDNNMLWSASDGNDYEIYFWNGNTIVQLTNNTNDDFALEISGNNVTWQNTDGQIYSLEIKNGGFLGTLSTDIINAGDGDDVVTSNLDSLQQNDVINGGTGIDTFIMTLGESYNNATINAGSSTNQLPSITGVKVVDFEKFDLTRFLGTVNFIGSNSNDWIKSGRGNDLLDGGLGEDQLMGGLGNDTYIVDNIRDSVTENLNEGNDLVQSTVNTTLTNNVENLTLLGTANLYGTGNNLDNTLTGNSGANLLKGLNGNDTLLGGAGNDTLIGGLGNDRLTGEGGADQFLFGSGSAFKSSNLGVDTLTDFTKNSDKIALSKVTFNALISPLGTLQSAEFVQINSLSNELSLVGSSRAKIVYNVATGNLFYNPDGAIAGLSNGGQFAIVGTRPNLSATDFLVQA